MTQTSVEERMEVGMPGMLTDSRDNTVITGINNSKQRTSVVIDAADLETTLTINGTPFTVNVGGGARTKTELRDDLIAAINAGSEPVTASIKDADELYVDADVSGTAFTYVDTANVTSTLVLPNETNVPFGVFVSLNNEAGQQSTDSSGRRLVHLPRTGTDVTDPGFALGIALHTQAVENALTGDDLGYDPQSAVSILRKGEVWVQVEDAVSEGGQAYVRHVAGAGEQLGAFRSDADGTDASALPTGYYRSSAAAGELAKLEINLA
jgi:hypothetical protein